MIHAIIIREVVLMYLSKELDLLSEEGIWKTNGGKQLDRLYSLKQDISYKGKSR